MHRREQRGEVGGPGLPQGDREAEGPGTDQPNLSRWPRRSKTDVFGLRGSTSENCVEKVVQKVS